MLATIASSHSASLAAHGEPLPQALTGGFHVAFLVGAAFAAAGALTALGALVRVRHPQQAQQQPAPAPVDA